MGDEAGQAVIHVAGRTVTLRRAAIAEILALRHAELRPGLPPSTASFPGDDDPLTAHFGAFDTVATEVLACASFMPAPWNDAPAYQLRGMATRRDLARRGIGAALLAVAEHSLATDLDVRQLWCNARITAADFYVRQGWAIASEPFDIPTVGPHVKMCKPLPARSAL